MYSFYFMIFMDFTIHSAILGSGQIDGSGPFIEDRVKEPGELNHGVHSHGGTMDKAAQRVSNLISLSTFEDVPGEATIR
jgi:hypothetical protein